MIEINLIEKKKSDASPYLLAGISLLLIALISVSFLIYHAHLENKQNALLETKAENRLLLTEINQQNQVFQQVDTLENQINQLGEVIYPSTFLVNQINSVVPEQSFIENYAFTIAEGLRVSIRTNSISDGAAFARSMQALPFIGQSSLVSMENKNESYLTVFTFTVDKQSLIEEVD
ncbi:hypothetical protein Pryu01_01269 [Paraliobacillus ryukyuensis]|uniref:Tfp pilus assembly protein PilN n=1 Tax=Paraliobacillus ryukyuensis TaxID=200904 RepID=A0A366EB00_9BACI|nr:hypothetical protein [Paraliobacillus ryukyuensis]RBO99497.1 Tfp pilus assembly protein PilN [Paraliobacillus ryukyuensis]